MTRTWLSLFAVLAVFALPGAELNGQDDSAEPEAISFPTTLDQIWYRTEKKRVIVGGQVTGDLIITPESLELVARKRELVIPFDTVHTISYGRMRGDVDTDWVVLLTGPPGAHETIGLRDGKKMGFGKRTERLHELIKEAARRSGSAQFGVPEGFQVYEVLERQFTLAIPQGWEPYHQSLVEVNGRLLWGRSVFSDQHFGRDTPETELGQALQRVEFGEADGFYLDRREVAAGMKCSGFSPKAERRLMDWIAEIPLLDGGAEVLDAPRAEPLPIGDCIGRRITARVAVDGGETLLDMRVVSDDETLFMFCLHSRAERYDRALKTFDQVVDSFRPSAARVGR